ncbi:MAG: hypothetical protein JJE22_11060 [Bacteroidia bacterium]|nr:hypothetical protein [Bacteroidia bacterium]
MKDLFSHDAGYGADLCCSDTGYELANKEITLYLKGFYLILCSEKSNNTSAITLNNVLQLNYY